MYIRVHAYTRRLVRKRKNPSTKKEKKKKQKKGRTIVHIAAVHQVMHGVVLGVDVAQGREETCQGHAATDIAPERAVLMDPLLRDREVDGETPEGEPAVFDFGVAEGLNGEMMMMMMMMCQSWGIAGKC